MEDGGTQGNTHPHTHARTRLTRTFIHSSGQSVWGPPGRSWPVLGLRGGRPSIPGGLTRLLLLAQAPGGCSAKPGKGLLQGTPKPLGRPVLCS